ncbi:MAG: AAA family ATPase [Myxococcaceae bacterium]|nr:AAA family ATPase [Myxococcaceae bacterium]
MFHRLIKPSFSNSFFLFGARGTGKTTWLEGHLPGAHVIDLLEDRWETRYQRSADQLKADLEALHPRPEWVVIDEVQKVPKLLDTVHQLIEKKRWRFALTGSSARKLKRGGANLLAGRAFEYRLFPLTSVELGKNFVLDDVLNWGSLPKIFSLDALDRADFLRAYASTYLREEILQEQLVRNGVAFRQFLEVAAQENGKTLNFTKIGRDVGVDVKTAQTFFQILEDTLVGFFLPAFHRSTRKSVRQQPKFYLFDLGVKRALQSALNEQLTPRTSGYGDAFEHFVIGEVLRLNHYARSDWNLFYYQTHAGGALDLVLHRGKRTVAVEIKSTDRVDEVEVRRMARVAEGIRSTQRFFVSNDTVASEREGVRCVHWRSFLEWLRAA